ncbi:hypothetical protein D8674_012900 [Pyrus ussuriensis x Pyrus communis]|uniref:Retrotransposon gag domain-containing protein n=1 Tax=Pyrus ussuriensis x Pyrus communis TaxID=2448454 RepID=A0A5N5GT00_9ROSA|nr:hypothetical protein D8674_012900 [Pyrus ussuriensis x Pyrus communis]
MALVQNETMGDLDIPTISESPSSIAFPAAGRNYELKTIHFNMMPSFHGMSTEDPLAHIRDIFNMMSNKNKFLEKFFSTQKTDTVRDNIMQFTQKADETFYEAWERFNNLLIYKAAVNNYTGGSIKNKTPAECQALFDTLALEMQHSEARGRCVRVSEIKNSTDFASKAQVDAIASKLDTLLSMNGRAPVQEKKNNLEDVIAQLVTIPRTTSKASSQSVIAATLLPKSVVPPVKPYVPPIHFPQWLKKNKLDEKYFKFLEMFKKLEINIPFVDALEQMPNNAKFMKDIISKKRKFDDHEKIQLTEECSAILQRKLPLKQKDRGIEKPSEPMEAALVHAATLEDENQLLVECALYLDAFKSVAKSGLLEFEDLGLAPLKSQPSIIAALAVNLKPLPSHLKYAYLGAFETLPVIISANLSEVEEEKLLRVLRRHRMAIG